MTENNMVPASLMEEIRSLKESMDRITSFILQLKHDYAVLEENIELSTSDVLRLLGISKASLARWREANSVPYRYVSCNHVVYPFKGLYIAIKTGRASFKGFRRLEALQRLNAYKDGVLKGYMGDDSQTLKNYEFERRNLAEDQPWIRGILFLHAD